MASSQRMSDATHPSAPHDGDSLLVAEGRLREVALLVAYGDPERRRGLAQQLVAAPLPGVWAMLAATVASQETIRFRAHSLEVLGLAAGHADATTSQAILQELAVAWKPAHGPSGKEAAT